MPREGYSQNRRIHDQRLLLSNASPIKREQPEFPITSADIEHFDEVNDRKQILERQRHKISLQPLPPMAFDMKNLSSVSTCRKDDVQQLMQQVEIQHRQRQLQRHRQRQLQREQQAQSDARLGASRSLEWIRARIDRQEDVGDIARLWNVDKCDDDIDEEGGRDMASSSSNIRSSSTADSRLLPLDESIRNYLDSSAPSPDAQVHETAKRLLLHLLRSTDMPACAVAEGVPSAIKQTIQEFMSLVQAEVIPASAIDTTEQSEDDLMPLEGMVLDQVEQQLFTLRTDADFMASTLASHYRELMTDLPGLLVERDRQLRLERQESASLREQNEQMRAHRRQNEAAVAAMRRRVAQCEAQLADAAVQVTALSGALDDSVDAEMRARDSRSQAEQHAEQGTAAREQTIAALRAQLAEEGRGKAKLAAELKKCAGEAARLPELEEDVRHMQTKTAQFAQEAADERVRTERAEKLLRGERESVRAMVHRVKECELLLEEKERALRQVRADFEARDSVKLLRGKYERVEKELRQELVEEGKRMAALEHKHEHVEYELEAARKQLGSVKAQWEEEQHRREQEKKDTLLGLVVPGGGHGGILAEEEEKEDASESDSDDGNNIIEESNNED